MHIKTKSDFASKGQNLYTRNCRLQNFKEYIWPLYPESISILSSKFKNILYDIIRRVKGSRKEYK